MQTAKFKEQLNLLYHSHPRTTELEKAITWYLGRTPRTLAYNLYGNYFLWITDQLPIKTIPKVKLVYQIDDENKIVKLMSIAEHIDQP